jgi:hypothetical protein
MSVSIKAVYKGKSVHNLSVHESDILSTLYAKLTERG